MKFARRFLGLLKFKAIKTPKGEIKPMKYAFTGLSGHKYFHYTDAVNDMNPARYIKLYMPMMHEYMNRLSNRDLGVFFDTCESFTTIQQYKDAHSVTKFKFKSLNLNTELIYDIMAVLYLREDEPNLKVPNELIAEKAKDIEQTMLSAEPFDHSFFLCPTFRTFLESVNILGKDWNALTQISEMNSKILSETLELIRSSAISKNIKSTTTI